MSEARLDEDQLNRIYEINNLKQDSFLIFYDYIIDEKEDLAMKFLRDPFIDVNKVEDQHEAKIQWGLFGKRAAAKESPAASPFKQKSFEPAPKSSGEQVSAPTFLPPIQQIRSVSNNEAKTKHPSFVPSPEETDSDDD